MVNIPKLRRLNPFLQSITASVKIVNIIFSCQKGNSIYNLSSSRLKSTDSILGIIHSLLELPVTVRHELDRG